MALTTTLPCPISVVSPSPGSAGCQRDFVLAVHVDCDSFVEVADIRFRKIGIRSVVGSAALAEPSGDRFLVDIVEFLLEFAVDQSPEVRLHVAHRDAILGLLRTGEAGSDRREVELYRFRVFGILFAE